MRERFIFDNLQCQVKAQGVYSNIYMTGGLGPDVFSETPKNKYLPKSYSKNKYLPKSYSKK